jgi:hypothetical protein
MSRVIPAPLLSAKNYVIIALVGLVLAVSFTVFYVYRVPKLIESGVQGQIFYLLLIPWALSCAAFLFGAMKSYARLTYKHLGNFLELGGPVVLFCLVLVGGFKLVPPAPETILVTFFVHGPGGPQDTVLQNSGEVVVDLGGDRRRVAIGEQGQAYFPAIPANFRGQEVLAWVSSDKFESTEANQKYKLDRQAIYLAVRRKAGRLFGLVETEDPKCLTGAQFRVAGLVAPVNPDSGRFELSIPGDRLQDELVLDATGPGCTPQHVSVVPNSNEIRITLRRSPAGSAKE